MLMIQIVERCVQTPQSNQINFNKSITLSVNAWRIWVKVDVWTFVFFKHNPHWTISICTNWKEANLFETRTFPWYKSSITTEIHEHDDYIEWTLISNCLHHHIWCHFKYPDPMQMTFFSSRNPADKLWHANMFRFRLEKTIR